MASLRSPAGLVGTILLALLWPQLCFAQNKPADFCSSLNTASGSANMSIYQTQGLCGEFCSGEYSFAILNDKSCWCSNYEPSEDAMVDDDECNIRCPAYTEWCGGKDDKYGYLELGKTPEGTKSPDSTATRSSTASSKTSEAPSSDDDSSSPTISTADGGQTVTITPSQSPDDEGGPALGAGAIAGIVVGVVGGVAAAAVAGFFLIRRRRARDNVNGHFDPRNSNSTAFTDMKDTSGIATPGAAMLAGNQAGNRGSRLLPADPRMDPYSDGLYVRTKSHESVNTLRDEQDYSRRVHQPRVLRATNPDPEQD